MYFAVLLLTALGVGPALRRIWRGGDGGDVTAETGEPADAGYAGGDSMAAGGNGAKATARPKKILV